MEREGEGLMSGHSPCCVDGIDEACLPHLTTYSGKCSATLTQDQIMK